MTLLFAWLFIAVMLLMILVPYLRGRSDLLTAWNLFLTGSALFVGWALVIAATARFHYADYVDADYYRYYCGVVVFYSTLTFTYYRFRLPRRIAGNVLLRWPPATPAILYLMLPIVVVFVLGMLFPLNIEGVRQFMFLIGLPALSVTFVLSFAAWYKQRLNPVLLATWLVLLVIVLYLTMQVAQSRRPILGTLMGIPIVMYWLRWRYRRPVVNLMMVVAVVVPTLVILAGFSAIRQQLREPNARKQGLRKTWTAAVTGNIDIRNMLQLDTAECSLLAIHIYTRDMPPEPFFTFYFVLANPIPREFWHNKPLALGKSLPHNGYRLYKKTKYDPSVWGNWGPGIVGHGYHEGGPLMLLFYGVLFGLVLRFSDEMLIRQRDNPYVLAAFAALAGNIIALSRGDIGVFTVEIIATCILTMLLRQIGRVIYGTGLTYPRTSHLNCTKQGFLPSAAPLIPRRQHGIKWTARPSRE